MMNKIPVHIVILAIVVLLASMVSCYNPWFSPVDEKRVAVRGEMNLAGYEFKPHVLVKLDGQWDFYWQRLLEPSDFTSSPLPGMTGRLTFPGFWNGYNLNGKTLKADGYATFRLIVTVPDADRRYGLKFTEMESAYRLWVNGKPAIQCGTVGKSREEMIPSWKRYEYYFQPGSEKVELVLQMSNYYHRRGGPEESIVFGPEETIRSYKMQKVAIELFLLGSILIMAIYHVILYFLRAREVAPFFFGFLCIVVGLRIPLSGEKLVYEVFPSITWVVATKIEYLNLVLIIPFVAMFFYRLYREYMSATFIKCINGVSIVLFIFILFTRAKLYTFTAYPIEASLVILGLYLIYILVRAIIHKQKEAMIVLVGMLFFFLFGLNDILYNNLIINTGYLAPVGLFLMLFSQAVLLSLRFTRAMETTEILSHDLEKQVQDRTRELSSEREKLEKMAREDSLTGLYNRRYVMEILGNEIKRYKRHGISFSLLMIDLDHFKEVNDTWGHPAGDRVLHSVGDALITGLRSTDMVGRVGGEEFMVILPYTNGNCAMIVAEKIRNDMRKLVFSEGDENYSITASIGVANVEANDTDSASIIFRADKALYRAKEKGRDRVESWWESE